MARIPALNGDAPYRYGRAPSPSRVIDPLDRYRALWEARLDRLAKLLEGT